MGGGGGGGRGGGGISSGRRASDHAERRRCAIVLATHLVQGGALEERDTDALLGWAVRTWRKCNCSNFNK